MKLFSKLKDYNETLEEILDNKNFSSDVKNLLLSMIYKAEISYKDYQKVKRKVRDKEEFLEELLDTIKNYCNNIKIVEPDSSQAKLLDKHKLLALTNEKEKAIITPSNEVAMLYAISDIEPKYFYITSDFMFKRNFQKLLVNGYNSNTVEVLDNFNGWAWDTEKKDYIDNFSNLIYQNILMIKGENFLNEWRNYASNKRNFLLEFQNSLKVVTGNNDYFNCLCRIFYKQIENKDRIDTIVKEKEKELKQMQDRDKFLEKIELRKQKCISNIEKIDNALEDEKLLIKEFNKRNEKIEDENKKITGIKSLKFILLKEREKFEKSIREVDYLKKECNFNRRKAELEEFVMLTHNKNTIEEEIIELQKCFLNYIDKRSSKIIDKEEFIDMIYELRYYRNILVQENTYIKDYEELEKIIDKILKKIITECCKIGYIKIFCMDIPLNYEIIRYALDTKIINLEETKLYFEFSKNEFTIDVYDKEVFEKQGKYTIENPKKQLEVKQKRMIKLFN